MTPTLVRTESPAGPYWYHPDHPLCQDGKVLWSHMSECASCGGKGTRIEGEQGAQHEEACENCDGEGFVETPENVPATMTLLSEIRTLVAVAAKPITLIAVPRWAALYLGRERAAELGTKLVQAHADALRHIPGKRQNNGACIMWLPVADHPFGGCFIFAHPAYEAGLLIAYSYREPILFPRRFSEQLREGIGGPLIPWRSDQDRWFNNPAVAEREMRVLTQECIRTTRKTPVYVHPSPFLVQVINDHAQSGPVMSEEDKQLCAESIAGLKEAAAIQ